MNAREFARQAFQSKLEEVNLPRRRVSVAGRHITVIVDTKAQAEQWSRLLDIVATYKGMVHGFDFEDESVRVYRVHATI